MKNKHLVWFLLALLGALLAAPNAMVLKFATGNIDPYYVNMLRFGIVAICCLPLMITQRKLIRKKQVRYAVFAGMSLAIAVLSFTKAIEMSEASYVSVIVLLLPIMLVLYSAVVYREKLTSKAFIGVGLAFAGAAFIILVPYLFRQHTKMTFYPGATILALIDCVFYPLSVIFIRKANQAGMSMITVVGISATTVSIISAGAFLIGGRSGGAFTVLDWLCVLYSALAVALVSRMLRVWTYERIGVAITSVLTYLDTFVAILLPVLILGETLSASVWVGGAIIMIGLYFVESHNLHIAKLRKIKKRRLVNWNTQTL